MFVDEVDILVESGAGGAGSLSFRREKFVPRGGPDGGDGGKGGSVYAVASPHLNTLISYRFNREFHARRGGHGQGSNRTGRDADDLELAVPVGTLIYEKPAGAWRRPDSHGRPRRSRTARAAGEGRHRRTGQRALRQLDQPGTAAVRGRHAGRNQTAAAPAQAPGRRGPRGVSERGEIDADFADFRGAAQDRRLPVHDADTESWRRLAHRTIAASSSPTCPGSSRARTKAAGSAIAF